MGSIIIFLFSVLIRFGMQATGSQAVQHEAFRKALYLADQARLYSNDECKTLDLPTNGLTGECGTPVNSADVVVVRDRAIANPSDAFASGPTIPLVAQAAITWGNDRTVVASIDPDPATKVVYRLYGEDEAATRLETDEAPKTFYDINGDIFAFNAANFVEIVPENGEPYPNPRDNDVCRFQSAIPSATMFGEVVGLSASSHRWVAIDPQRRYLLVTIQTQNCNALIGSAPIDVGVRKDLRKIDKTHGTTYASDGAVLLGLLRSCPRPPPAPCEVDPLVKSRLEAQKVRVDLAMSREEPYRIRFWALDPCMADANNPLECARQCNRLAPKDMNGQPVNTVLEFKLPPYCTTAIDPNVTQGVDFNNYTRTRRVKDRLLRSEDGQTITTHTRVDERERLERTFTGWRKQQDVTTEREDPRNGTWQTWETPK